MTIKERVKQAYWEVRTTKLPSEIDTREFIQYCSYHHGLAPNSTSVERYMRRLKKSEENPTGLKK